jgi:hypothetical protein
VGKAVTFSEQDSNYLNRTIRLDWINLAQDRDWWQVLLNTVIDLQVP